ncbi:putative tRNA pseudouridine synthase Pus10 [Phlyctochytrium planicorne]|nr:putative tRNA pseudouridine synthase Pus10 [Phlyctochytrium planicorne]
MVEAIALQKTQRKGFSTAEVGMAQKIEEKIKDLHMLKELGIEYLPPVPTAKNINDRTKNKEAAAVAAEQAETGGKRKREEKEGEAKSEGETKPADDGPIQVEIDQTVDVKDILKILLTDTFAEISKLSFDPESQFQIDVDFDHMATDGEYNFMTKIPAALFAPKKRRQGGKNKGFILEGASWETISKAAFRITYDDFVTANQIPILPVTTACVASDLRFFHQSIYFAGRYQKLVRGISNSRWEINGERIAADSVEELIADHVDPIVLGESHKFSSAGREDVDVLMLGNGRPFYLEVCNPRKPDVTMAELVDIEQKINDQAQGKIVVTHLQRVSKESTWSLKDSASTKKKAYTTLVKLSTPVPLSECERISAQTEILLKQQTPIRVSARRSDLIRDKIIHSLKVYFEPHTSSEPRPEGTGDGITTSSILRVDLTTSAGTYVKEFVHGDAGRTVPSLREMLDVSDAAVETLDVVDVDLDWPPPRPE